MVPYGWVRGNHDSARTEAAVPIPERGGADDEVRGRRLVVAGIGDPVSAPDGTASSASAPDPQTQAGTRLAQTVRDWDAEHPDNPVDLVAVHEPAASGPLLGTAPLVLTGHLHSRDVVQDPSGTLHMVQGSTGGAGFTAGGFERIRNGQPLPLEATLVYLGRGGDRDGEVIGYDEVTVGGYGMASVSVDRKVRGSGGSGTPPDPSPRGRPRPARGIPRRGRDRPRAPAVRYAGRVPVRPGRSIAEPNADREPDDR